MSPRGTGQTGLRELRRRTYIWAAVGAVLAVSSIVRYGSSPGKVAALALGVIAMPALVMAGISLASWRRARSVADPNAFASSSSQQANDLARVPRFASMIPSMVRLDETDGWIGGGLVVDAAGIRWNPTRLSRRLRKVPDMEVSWQDVSTVEVEPTPGIGDPAFVHITLSDGSIWTLNAFGPDRLRRSVDHFHS